MARQLGSWHERSAGEAKAAKAAAASKRGGMHRENGENNGVSA